MPAGPPIIAAEGRAWIVIAVAAAAAMLLWRPELAPIPALIAVLLVLWFRDPRREIPADALAVVSPVDGWVREIEPTDRGVLEGEAQRISIRINNFGAYSVRSPVEGKVLDLREYLGDGARLQSGGLWLRTDADEDFVLLITSGLPGLRPAALIGYGQRVGQGQRCALLRLAGSVDLYVPVSCRIETQRGAYVRAGSDVLATIVRR